MFPVNKIIDLISIFNDFSKVFDKTHSALLFVAVKKCNRNILNHL